MISAESLKKFKELYKKHFNEELSDEDALERAIKLRRMVEIVYQPITEKEYEDWKTRRAERGENKQKGQRFLLQGLRKIHNLQCQR